MSEPTKTTKPRRRKTTKKTDVALPKFFGQPLPGIDEEELTGKLIVVEGTDGSGRSTQITLLREWLESAGFPVSTLALRRSNLMAADMDSIVERNSVTPRTLALLYATDLFDQMENQLIPALRSGFVVLADRYIFSLIARSAVRGIEPRYLEQIYQLAVRPDLTFCLDVDPKIAFEREVQKGGIVSFWEAGRDLALSDDVYQSFLIYQRELSKQLRRMSRREKFIHLDANLTVQRVNTQIRGEIARVLGIRRKAYTPSPELMRLWK